MATIYIPNDYPDLGSALAAASNNDTIVLVTSQAILTHDIQSSLDGITIQAADGYVPVIDHTNATDFALEVSGDDWTFEGLTFRSTEPGSGGAALSLDGTTGHTIDQCVFEGNQFATEGDFEADIVRCQFRHVTEGITTSTDAMTFDSCEIIRCGGECLNASAAAVANCTFIACEVSVAVCLADTIVNCTAQGSKSEDPSGHVYDGTTSITYCNAYESDVGGSNFNAPTTSNNTTVNPQHVNLYTDLRLLPTSPLIRAGTATGAASTDYNGAAFQAPPSIGAHESIVIASATASDADTVAVVLTGTYVEAQVEDRNAWTLVSVSNGIEVTPASVVWTSGSSTATITTWPTMSPGVGYTVQCDFGGYGYDTASFTPSSSFETVDEVQPYRYVAAIMNAFGRQFLDLAGVPQTNLAEDFSPDAETVLVYSTLYFPDEGAFWVAGLRFTYTSKTDGAFHGVEGPGPRITSIPEGTLVVADERAHQPDP